MNGNYRSLAAAMLFLSLSFIASSTQAQHAQSHTDDAQHEHADGQQCQMMQGGGDHDAQAGHGNGQGMDHGQCQMMQAGNGQHGGNAGQGDGQSMDHSQHQMMQAGNGGHGGGQQSMGSASQPATAGQSGFAAVQEMVAMLEADPNTDWTQVNLDMLRSHLIDMDRVMMDATVQSSELANGMRHRITGDAQVTASIKRMVPAHVEQMRTEVSWAISMSENSSGVVLEITASESSQIAKIKGLGFAGFMVLGDHHQPHHLQMATGDSHQH